MIDNFTLMDVGNTVLGGLQKDRRAEIHPSKSKGYVVRPVPSAGVQVENLLQFLNALVLQDKLIVDADNTHTWSETTEVFAPVLMAGVLECRKFSEDRVQWLPRRAFAEEALCFTPRLRADFQRYKKAFPQVELNPAMSTVLWGTAGMLARSDFARAPYLGHPTRGRLIAASSLAPVAPHAGSIVDQFIATERVRFFDRLSGGMAGRYATLQVSPLALEVVAESREVNDLVPTAVQLRAKYRRLREWIAEYQSALNLDDQKAARKKALLEAAARDVDRSFRQSWWKDLTLTLGFGISGPAVSVDRGLPVSEIVGRFLPWTIRASLVRMIQEKPREQVVGKLLRMLDAPSPRMHVTVLKHLQANGAIRGDRSG